MNPQDLAKKAAAERACEFVTDGMTVGLGTGSTADFMVRRLGERVAKDGLKMRGVPTSVRTEQVARSVGVPLATLDEVDRIDVTIDGADEVDARLDLVKGLGGALLREKVVASITDKLVIVVDPTKLVQRLGTKAPLPVEVVPFAQATVARAFRRMGHDPRLRAKDGKTFVTDNGNVILDVHVAGGIPDARGFEDALLHVPGVVDSGLFLGRTWKVVVGEPGGATRVIDRA